MNDEASQPVKRNFLRRSSFFWISLGVHGLLLLGAATLVVQNIAAKRKVSFKGVAEGPRASERALEYKVTSPTTSASSPALARRIAATGVSAIALPKMPDLPDVSEISPISMPGLSGGSLGFGLGSGAGFGTGGGGGGGGSGAPGKVSIFGSSARNGEGLVGYLYDLKQNKDRTPSGANFESVVLDFVRKNFDQSVLSPFYKSPPLYATQIMIPSMAAEEGPKAFGVENDVKPTQWLVHYQGKVSSPKSATIHFVGCGDDVMFVKFDGVVVLDRCWYMESGLKSEADYLYSNFGFPHGGLAKSKGIPVMQGKWYDMEVLIGEQPGVGFHAVLLIEEDGSSYKKDPLQGSPILSPFRLAVGGKAFAETDHLPPLKKGGPVWSGRNDVAGPALSPLDALKPN